LAVAQGFDTDDLVEIALRVSKSEKLNKARARMVVLTRGNDPVLFVQGKPLNNHLIQSYSAGNICRRSVIIILLMYYCTGDLIRQFPVIDVPENKIKDTNGAGDAFVGG